MTRTNRTLLHTLTPALKAIGELFQDRFAKLNRSSELEALSSHSEIKRMPVSQKRSAFFRHFLPLRKGIIELVAESYRRYFKLALAHPSQAGGDPEKWAWHQLQPAVGAALEWIRDWYVLTCDGENRWFVQLASIPITETGTISLSIPNAVPPLSPPTSWRAPAWLFAISPLDGIGPLKRQHVPARDSGEKLGEVHTRLLLKGARKVFLWELGAAIETVRNEEIAAAGAVPAEMAGGQGEQANKAKHWLKGAEGLVRKSDLSKYMHNLTEKQQLASSLKYEYELGLAEIASRMGIDHKTAYEHIKAAESKINQTRSSDKRKTQRAKNTDQ
jgi:hypothetical protein